MCESWRYSCRSCGRLDLRKGGSIVNSFTYGNEGKEGYAIKINGQYNQKELEYFFGENIKNVYLKGIFNIDVVGFDQLKGLRHNQHFNKC